MITDKELEKKIEEVEELLKQKITILNYDFYGKLLIIHGELYQLRFFKKHQEKNFLEKEDSE